MCTYIVRHIVDGRRASTRQCANRLTRNAAAAAAPLSFFSLCMLPRQPAMSVGCIPGVLYNILQVVVGFAVLGLLRRFDVYRDSCWQPFAHFFVVSFLLSTFPSSIQRMVARYVVIRPARTDSKYVHVRRNSVQQKLLSTIS